MAQKVIEGGVVTWRHMHEISRWLNYKMAQNLDHVSKLRECSLFQTGTLRWLKIRTETEFEILIASNSEPSQSFGS